MVTYDIRKGVRKINTKKTLTISSAALGIAGLLMSLVIPSLANAATSTIYNNIPSPLPGNIVSEGPEAYAFAELGGQVQFDGTNRQNPTVTVAMSSWACQTGHWYDATCVTAPGATDAHPITLSVYAVNPDNSPGTKLATATSTFTMPYRPSTDSVNCTGGRWFDGTTCFNGKAFTVAFSFSSLALPSKAIVSVAYNTSHYGYSPIGESAPCYISSAGCFYDSLNIGLNSPTTVGTDPLPNDAYLYSNIGGEYCQTDQTTTGTFRLDQGCWTGYQPAFKVDASSVAKPVASATGGVTLSNPRQQLSFEAHDNGALTGIGNVNYTNFDANLHYNADLTCTNVSGNTAYFAYQIPNNSPVAAGVWVVWKVIDGGSPGKGHDTAGFVTAPDGATATSLCQSGVFTPSNYVITAGNLVVH